MTRDPRVLAICGGGNAGHALAVATSKNFAGDVVWLTSTPEKAELLRRAVFAGDGLQSTGVITGSAHRVRAISSEPAEIIPDADIVVIAVPAFAHAPVLKRIAPHLKDDALIGALPTRGGFEFEATAIVSGIEPEGRRRIFGLQTLPWSTRIVETGKRVNFGALKATVPMAMMPRRQAPQVAAQLTQLLGTNIVATDNFLNMTLGNPGQIVHPGLMYGLFAGWAGQLYSEDSIPFFYKDASDATGAFVAGLSSDVVAVAKAIETESNGALDLSGVLSILQWQRVTYPTQTADTSTVATCFRTGPIQARKAPMREAGAGNFVPNFEYRYLSEDVPYGLVVSKAIAQMTGVPTPSVDAVIQWTQAKLGKRYVVADTMEGSDARELPIPQNHGIRTLSELIAWYAAPRAAEALASASS